jgi:WYL_2, Sm-like SH3 beta-barrel fold
MSIPKSKSEANQLLTEQICEVHFTKKDGTSRKMLATLMPEWVNKVASKNGKATGSTRNVPEHQICCIDTEKGEWRSFTIDSITSFKPL